MNLEFSTPRKLQANDDLSDFSCGVEKIDKWVAKYAMKAENAAQLPYMRRSQQLSNPVARAPTASQLIR